MIFKNSFVIASLALLNSLKASAACSQVSGNYYCDEASAILYSGVGYSGTYKDVTNMDESSCECSQSSVSFSSDLSPLNEELSVHFRGPLKLSQFAVYYPASSYKKVKRDADPVPKAHHRHHVHKRAASPRTTTVFFAETIYVDTNGYSSFTSSLSSASVSASASSASASASVSALSSSLAGSSKSTVGGSWSRSSYYTPGSAQNLVFLNNLGGVTDSGTWSSCFGNSLSFCAANGQDASSSSQVLKEVTIGSDVEYIIYSGSKCGSSSASGDCGYYRSGIPAYHGFGGSNKIFAFEFTMPTDSGSASDSNYDMPAIWLLNAKIPRTLQYGSSSCSCWSTGCGELDLFEILSSGSDKLISHLHTGQGSDGTSSGGGGSSDFFKRPTSSSMKAVAVLSGSSISIVKVDDFDFSSSLDESTVNGWLSESSSSAVLV
ncbi:Tos1p ASCRUDRAFT_30144 [Ascoidea rubescens DSM 1968]|uniref:glucan endo-1,3-beta-D-glucosidase n=1 Tax=Ascoidea rubescens DSM 1968 TaxID=1344418 RepID=A0A1D2VRV6_9ASCO|nr:hypothetical protein ASCRUDRAFT_30144 [Ascoidea rubescens DSM 1968]ODV64329.1 hypothetical protein ASCRUDRAFT_30144 [Ascoidea rubescens DSM 1968]